MRDASMQWALRSWTMQQASVNGEEATMRYYIDDPDQLPELPPQGPRDGRHGVDRDVDFDPYPPRHFGVDTGGDLAVGLEDAKIHLGLLLDRVERGEEIIIVRHGHPVALLAPYTQPTPMPEATLGAIAASRELLVGGRPKVQVVTAVYDEGNQMPELPDPGPRDNRHGVDRELTSKRQRT
jgi:prevent-host-death family protein